MGKAIDIDINLEKGLSIGEATGIDIQELASKTYRIFKNLIPEIVKNNGEIHLSRIMEEVNNTMTPQEILLMATHDMNANLKSAIHEGIRDAISALEN